MHKQMVRGILISLITLTPFAAIAPQGALAQVSAFDDTTRANIAAIVQRVGPMISPDITASDARVVLPSKPEPEVVEESVEYPELNLTDLQEYSNQGVTIQVPAEWIVNLDTREDEPFTIEVPGAALEITLQADTGLDFPSWLGVALFRSQAQLLMEGFGAGAHVEESATLYTEQNLPIAKLTFSGGDPNEIEAGSLYVLAPNETAYILTVVGSTEARDYAAPGLELIAQSITFDDDLITVVNAGAEPLRFTDEDETVEVTVPAGWYAIATGDPQFPAILAEPEVRYVVAIGTQETFGGAFDPNSLEEYIPAEGELDPEKAQELIDTVFKMVSDSGSPIVIDEELSNVVAREGAVTVYLVGDADLGDGISIPVILSIDLRTSGVGVAAIFGDTESALELGDALQTLLESVTGL